MVEGHEPATGVDLLTGRRRRRVNVFDATFSAPKTVSLLWGLGRAETADVVSRAHTEAVSVALSFLEDHAAVARQQTKGVRRGLRRPASPWPGSSTARRGRATPSSTPTA